MSKKKSKKLNKLSLILTFFILFVAAALIFKKPLISKVNWVRNDHRIKSTYEEEYERLQRPLDAFGGKIDQSVSTCHSVITAVRKNEPNLYGQRCIQSVGGYAFIENDNKDKIVAAAKQLNKDLKENNWQPSGGHADIAFWINHLVQNGELLTAQADTAPFFQNYLSKQLDQKTICEIDMFSHVEQSQPIGIRINFSCIYDESRY